MNAGLGKLNSRRMWVVPNVVIWGLAGLGEVEYLSIEQVDAIKSISFGSAVIGDTAQSVNYNTLQDVRGNLLPATIKEPLVMVRSQNESQVFVVGVETNTGFRIARDSDAKSPVTVDLIITEMGE